MILHKPRDCSGHEGHAIARRPEEAAVKRRSSSAAPEDAFSLLFKYTEDLSEMADCCLLKGSVFCSKASKLVQDSIRGVSFPLYCAVLEQNIPHRNLFLSKFSCTAVE